MKNFNVVLTILVSTLVLLLGSSALAQLPDFNEQCKELAFVFNGDCDAAREKINAKKKRISVDTEQERNFEKRQYEKLLRQLFTDSNIGEKVSKKPSFYQKKLIRMNALSEELGVHAIAVQKKVFGDKIPTMDEMKAEVQKAITAHGQKK